MERLSQTYIPLGIGSGSLIARRYEIDQKLGAGSSSAVYRARDKALNNSICAIKIIDTKNLSSESDIERFRNEVIVTRKLTHPNIVRTFEFGQTEAGQFYITMEYLEGKSLEDLANKENGLISIAEVVFYLKAIASGMQSAHDAKVIHRDLKPANILVSEKGEIKITDFGLAKQKELDLNLTSQGECVGTPAYMSPEQLQGYQVDYRTDIYSFGILAYELLTGKLPFIGKDWFSLGKSIVTDPLPEINAHKTKVPLWLCNLIRKCTNKNPEDRPASFNDVLHILEQTELEEKDLLTRITETKISSNLIRFNVIRYAPFIFAISLGAVGAMLFIEASSKSAEKINQGVNNSQVKINRIVDNMNKAITVLQKFDQNSEAINRAYEKSQIEEQQIKPAPLPENEPVELLTEEEDNLRIEDDTLSPSEIILKKKSENNKAQKISRPFSPKRVKRFRRQ